MRNKYVCEFPVTLFSGFLQKESSPGNGLIELERRADYLGICLPNVKVRLFTWNANTSDAAEALWRDRPKDENRPQKHIVGAYSYGGQAAMNFLEELELRQSFTVEALFLCDPVRRSKLAPGVLAATGTGTFFIPKYVKRLYWYRQMNPRYKLNRAGGFFQPAGHDVVLEDPHSTELIGPFIKTEGHCYIDNDTQFLADFVKEVKLLCASAKEAYDLDP